MSSPIEVCMNLGHDLKQFIDKVAAIDPVSKVAINSYKILCSRCGTALEKIADARPPRTRRKPEPKSAQGSAA